MEITPIIINGRHGGQILPTMEYSPIIRLPIKEDIMLSIGEECDNSVRIGDVVEYKECFRSVDKRCVMYSTNGRFEDIRYALLSNLKRTYPVDLGNLSEPFYPQNDQQQGK